MAIKRSAATTKKAAPTKKAPAKKAAPVKKAVPAKKAAPVKKAPAKKAVPVKKAAPAKQITPPKKAVPVEKTPPVKKAEPKKAPAPKPLDQKFLDSQVALLNEQRATLLSQAQALTAEADALARDREPGDVQFDDESGEGDTLAVERDFDLTRAASAMHVVEEIDDALERVKKGTYGICEYSGLAIPRERLKAIPYARERVEFKTRSFR